MLSIKSNGERPKRFRSAVQWLTKKRGNGAQSLALDDVEDVLATYNETPEQLLIIDDLLRQMEDEHPRWVRIVDARYFSGMSEAETAAIFGLSERTVRREWKAARDWLETQMLS
jgi:DNA-directed RNA polymerase specialized sigma24 family protein